MLYYKKGNRRENEMKFRKEKTYNYNSRMIDGKLTTVTSECGKFNIPTIIAENVNPAKAILEFQLNRKPNADEIKYVEKIILSQAKKRANQVIANPIFGYSKNDKADLVKRFSTTDIYIKSDMIKL